MGIKYIINPKSKDLGGFSVYRVLPAPVQQMVGPWIFFDHMGPASFEEGNGIDVRPHPHINLATVTYLFEGEILHRDSLGSIQAIRPGDINLMVAGRGIVHSERESDDARGRDRALHGLQLWHALPSEHEEIDPAFYHYKSSEIPRFNHSGLSGRVMIGSAYGVSSPVMSFCDTLYIEAKMESGGKLKLPEAEQIGVYVVSGSIEIDGQKIDTYNMAILDDNTGGAVKAGCESQIAIIGGEKMPPRFIEWNFVSSKKERIEKAKDDWQNGCFPKVPGDEDEFIPLPQIYNP